MSYLEPVIVKSSPTSIDVMVEIIDCHVRLEEWRTLTDICAISILILIFFSFELQFLISFFILYFEFEFQVRVEDSGRYQCSSRGRRQWVDLTVVESRIF